MNKLRTFWRSLGPGLITGASDDDPAGITVYSVAGAKFGLAALWTALATLPFMIVIQRMAGRIGLISGKGLAGNMKKYYPAWMLIVVAFMVLFANVINIGADISAMAAAIGLLLPFPPLLTSVILSVGIVVLVVALPYRQIANCLKWIALIMLSYILAAFFVYQPWKEILYRTFVPQIILNKAYIGILVALFGTTISPYLFFWQASEEVEEERLHHEMIPAEQPHGPHRSRAIIKNEIGSMYKDVYTGMTFSNIITFFIITLSAATLFRSGFTDIDTIEGIAAVLRPLAGPSANLLFMVGIVASGILAIPILAGSAAYALAEMFGWKDGLNNQFHKAKGFYMVMILSTLLGLLIPLLHFNPVQILIYTAVIFGFISPFLILLVIHMANNRKIMGAYTSRRFSNILAYILFGIMSLSVIAMILI